MQLICPQCNYTRELEGSAIPDKPVQVTCPKCNAAFRFDPTKAEPSSGGAPAPPEAPSALRLCLRRLRRWTLKLQEHRGMMAWLFLAESPLDSGSVQLQPCSTR